MREAYFAYWFVSLGIILVLGCVVNVADLYDNSTRSIVIVSNPEFRGFPADTPHVPVVIDGDANFSDTVLLEGWPGDGSPENPFIIDGLDIDLGGAFGNCISISNTRVNFTISNSNLTGANYSVPGNGAGIYLENVTYGKLVNNTCNNSYAGIYLGFSSLIEVANSSFTNDSVGIYLDNSDSNTLSDNIFDTSQLGIFLQYSSLNSIARNHFNDHIYSIRLEVANSNIMMNNTCNGNSQSGINLQISHSNTIMNNTLSNNSQYGIYIQVSDSNKVMNNTYNNNNIGISLDGFCHLNDILWNVFVTNAAAHASDGGSGDVFDYNFWSGYDGYDTDENGVGDTPYSFPGNQDLHPLMAPPDSPPFWLEFPVDQVISFGEPLRYDLNASIYGGWDNWWINDTDNFAIDQSGVLTNMTILLPERYGIHVSVSNSEGTALSKTFTVIVEDGSPPTWLEAPVNQLVECGASLRYYLNATDVSGLDTWWLNDTLYFAIDNDGQVTSIGIVAVGVYGVQVWVNDTRGNTLTGLFAITVVDTLAPAWGEQPQNQTIEYGTTYVCDLDATDPSGIGDWWVDDTIHFVIDWLGQIRTVGILELGTYGLRVYVSDIYGHTLFVSITVEVIAATTTSTTASTTIHGFDPVMALILGVAIGVGATIILFTVLLKKNVRMIRE